MRKFLIVLGSTVLVSRADAQTGRSFSPADSMAVVRAAARVAVTPRPGAAPACIQAVKDTVLSPLGRAFAAEVGQTAALLRPADGNYFESAWFMDIAAGDTAVVRVGLSGVNGVHKGDAMWLNHFSYRFVRDTAGGDWRYLDKRGMYFADGELIEEWTSPPRHCLNARP